VAETIKEFLVSIGYKVDGSSERRFEDSLKKATLRAELLGRAIAEAAEAIVKGAVKIAQGFDDIYYASQRTKASVDNLKSLSYAVSQLGGSYGGALQSFEAFGAKLRNNPGYSSLVRSLGVATEQNGKIRDTAVVMTELAKVLDRKPRHVAIAYLEALGIDERTYDALKSGDLVKYTEEYRKKQVQLGVDQKRTAEIGKDLTVAWRQMSLTLATLGEKLLQSVGPGLTELVKRFDEFLVKNAPAIERFFQKLVEILGEVVKAFVTLVEKGEGPIVEMFDKIGKSLDTLTTALTVFATFLVGTWLVRVLGAFSKVSLGFAGMLTSLGLTPAALAAGLLIGSTSSANAGEDAEIARRRANGTWGNTPTPSGGGGSARSAAPAAPAPDTRNWWQRNAPKWAGGKEAPASGGRRGLIRKSSNDSDSKAEIRGATFREKSPGIMKRLMADFNLTKEEAAAVMGNLGHESGGLTKLQEQNPTVPGSRGGYGWAQWTGPRRRAFEAWAAEKGLDPSSDEANYGFMKHELRTTHKSSLKALKAEGSLEDKTRAFERSYEGAGIKHYASRDRYANRALNAYEKSEATAANPEVKSPAAATPGDPNGPTGSRQTEGIPNGLRRTGSEDAPQAAGGKELPPLARMQAAQDAANRIGGATGATGPAPLTPGATNTTSTTVGMTQNTAINVTGGSDPTGTGNAVADRQREVNAMLLRQLKEGVR